MRSPAAEKDEPEEAQGLHLLGHEEGADGDGKEGADGDGMKGADGDGMILEVNNLEVKSKGEWKTWVMEAFASELEEGIDGYELAEQAVRVLGQTEAAKRWNIPNPEDVAHKLLNESYLKRN